MIEEKTQEAFFSWEAFLLGGLSILTCLGCWAFADRSASVYTMSQLAFSLAFVFNHPHFLSSYNLLYGDFRGDVLKKPKYFWAAVAVPFALGALLLYCLVAADAAVMGDIVNAMFFLVGWHYIKQVFGCVIVTCARRRMYFSTFERRLLLSNLFCLWALSWLQSQAGNHTFDFYGITYASLGLPEWTLAAASYGVGLTGLAVAWTWVQKYIREGHAVNSSALMAIAALYVWYLPAFSHPYFAYLIPLFHSLQYLVFVWSFKRNQVTDRIQDMEGAEQRQAWITQFAGFLLTAAALGALSFEFVPKWLDGQHLFQSAGLGSSPVLAATLLFINIHHYFIDNVIWRSHNGEIKKYLFATPATVAQDGSQKKAA
jgi:hypothetical protein